MREIISFLNNHSTISQVVKLVLIAVAATVIAVFLLKMERKLSRKIEEKHEKRYHFLGSFIRLVIIFLAVLWVVMSSEITRPLGQMLFQGSAILSAVVGFAAQPVLADMICGMMIHSHKPFVLGDRIELEDGTAGIVKDMTIRHVVISTLDTTKVVIPNSRINGMKITNMSYHMHCRSFSLRIGVAYPTDPELAEKVIGKAVEDSPYTIPGKNGEKGNEYAPVYFLAFQDSSLLMATTVYFHKNVPTEVVRSDVNTRVNRALKENHIEIPYQYVNIVMHDDGDGTEKTDAREA